jgi:hypothetical protein
LLVYGDHCDLVGTAEQLQRLDADASKITSMPPGIARHSALVSLLVEAGRLEQGVADAAFVQCQQDRPGPAADRLSRYTHGIAKAVLRSWDSGFSELCELPHAPAGASLPDAIALKVPEGYAFYAVYPEAYAVAALGLKLTAPPRVIGIRSIGTSLAAIVAAAFDARPAVTVRPFGDPFDRRIDVAPDLADALLNAPAHFVVVDEGPGLSGSSFGAVADWLQARGVPLERIAFLTSHAGPPGREVQPRHGRYWSEVQRITGDFRRDLGPRLAQWATRLLGPLDNEPVEISAGAWRQHIFGDLKDWPPAATSLERRKFLLTAGGRKWLAKFAGLGSEGQRKLAMARTLHREKLAPEPLDLVHGFLIGRWHGDASPLSPGEQPLEEIAHYLGARARLLQAPRPGASLAELLSMAKRNAGLALGAWAEERLDAWTARMAPLQERVVPACVDGRLDRHEWLRLPGGRLIKTDGLDHHAAHDLIGCQDIAWDVAGASVEFDLAPKQSKWLAATVGRTSGRLVDPELLSFLTQAYLAFRLGYATLSMSSSGEADFERWRSRAADYSSRLHRLLSQMQVDATRRDWPIERQPERTGAGTILMDQGS